MNKLKTKKINKFLNYFIFYKKINKENKKFNNIFFNFLQLYKKEDSIILEFNNIENICLPYTLKIKEIFTIKKKIKNTFFFNYELNYNILYIFNKIMFIYNKKIIKSRIFIIKRQFQKNENFYILFLGIIFTIKKKNLFKYYNIINKKNSLYFNIKKKKI